MTEEAQAFRQKPEYRDKLAELLKDPVLQLAMDVVEGTAKPKPLNETEISTVPDAVIVRRHTTMAGMIRAFNELKLLAQPIKPGETDNDLLARAYEHSVPAQFREEKPKC